MVTGPANGSLSGVEPNLTYPAVVSSQALLERATGNQRFTAGAAGGLGLLATAFAPDPEFVRTQIKETQKLTDKPFGANLQVMSPHTPKIAEILVEEGIGIVTISGGSPKTLIPFLHERGIKALVVVPTVYLLVFDKSEAPPRDSVAAEETSV